MITASFQRVLSVFHRQTPLLLFILILAFVLLGNSCFGQGREKGQTLFRNPQLDELITPFRIPLPSGMEDIHMEDLDKDGDPDVLHSTIHGGRKVLWIDDDDDMRWDAVEGDRDNDCLMIDINGDGRFGGEKDLIIDWIDSDGDGKADWQAIVDNGAKAEDGKWQSHYIWFADLDGDGVFGYVDGETMKFEGWDHGGRAHFFADYNGKSMMLKVHITTWDIEDPEYSWENPFLFYDPDEDGSTEMAIRMVDEPVDQKGERYRWKYSHRISLVQMTVDMDNDNTPENPLDYDMSLKFYGKGFDYSDQVHSLGKRTRCEEADRYFEDIRWRQLEELIYTGHDEAKQCIFGKGQWSGCWFVFDEDDDCQRWERVEFYTPKDPFKIGTKNGGVDHNPQADASGDRGEWDTDFSGKGQLYLSPLDGKLHLYGAEKGYWRIDQNAMYWQGWQGWRGPNLQPEDFENIEPTRFPTVRYEDRDSNGFMDVISWDVDGDHLFEETYDLKALGIPDTALLYQPKDMDYDDYHALYKQMADHTWRSALSFVKLAKDKGLSVEDYAILMHPSSLRERYHNGFWLKWYLWRDLKHVYGIKHLDATVLDQKYFTP